MNYTNPITEFEDIKIIRNYLKTESNRNYFLFHLGINLGIRIGDLIKLKVKDIKNKSKLVIVEDKTSKIKIIQLNPLLKLDIKNYIQLIQDDIYLFQSRKGNSHITRQQALRIIKNAIFKTNLNNKYDNIGTHSLRKTFTYFNMIQNNNIEICKGLLNHNYDIRTIKPYIINDYQKQFYI